MKSRLLRICRSLLLALGWELLARLNIVDSLALPPLSKSRGRLGRPDA